MQQAIKRINELQQETIDKADQIDGAKEYVEQQMKLFNEAEKHRKQLNMIIQQQNTISEQFIKV
jgi:hypothetical protein